MPIEFPKSSLQDGRSEEASSQTWRQRATRIDPSFSARLRDAVREASRTTYHENRFTGDHTRHGLHTRTRLESWLISLPEELQSDELLRAITSGEVNCLLGSCEPFGQPSELSKSSDIRLERD